MRGHPVSIIQRLGIDEVEFAALRRGLAKAAEDCHSPKPRGIRRSLV